MAGVVDAVARSRIAVGSVPSGASSVGGVRERGDGPLTVVAPFVAGRAEGISTQGCTSASVRAATVVATSLDVAQTG